MIQKKIGRFMGLSMGITMSFTMSLVGSFLGSVFFAYILPNVILKQPTERPVISVVISFILGFLLSWVITTIIALVIGFIVPMKKINDSIEAKCGGKGFKAHFFQSLVSDCIYTFIIGLAMAFLMTAVFAIPQQKKALAQANVSIENQIAGLQAQLDEIQANADGVITDEEMAAIPQLTGQIEGMKGAIAENNAKIGKLKLVPTALLSWARSFPIEFIIALIVIMIIEPIYQKIAFKKYIPNYGKDVDASDL